MAQAEAGIKLPLTSFHVWTMGITVVIGGQYFGWNAGLTAGFGTFTVAFACIASAYYCLCMCTAELSSCVPFAGGSYGLARCSFGSHIGFIVGCCEAFEYMIYVAVSAISLGDMFVTLAPSIGDYVPLVWVAFYASSLFFHIRGGYLFWNLTAVLAIISTAIILIFIFGSLKFVDFNRYAELRTISSAPGSTGWFSGGMAEFMTILPLPAWFFVGVESLNMMCEDSTTPNKIIPRGQMWCIATLLVTAILVLFVCVSLPPGIDEVASSLAPFNQGFSLMFNVEPRLCSLLSLPATYATAFGFIYSYGKLLVAMAESRLLPEFFAVRYGKNKTAAAALVTGSVVGLGICFICRYSSYVSAQLFNLCMLCSFTAYISQCVGFMHLRYNFKFTSNSDSYTSPLGYAGACISIVVWLLGITSIIAFQSSPFAVVTYLVIVVCISIYYYVFARHCATLSSNENEILFFAHWIHLQHYKPASELDEGFDHVNRLHGPEELEKIKLWSSQRMHADVIGAAKLNLLREYGKIGGSLAEGSELTEAEVQRLRLLYSTPSKNWFNSAHVRELRSAESTRKPTKWRLGRQEGNWIESTMSKEENDKQQQFEMLMSYKDETFYDISEDLVQPPMEHAPIPMENTSYDDEQETTNRSADGQPRLRGNSFDSSRDIGQLQNKREQVDDDSGQLNAWELQFQELEGLQDNADTGIRQRK